MSFYNLIEEINFSHKRYMLESKILNKIIAKGYSCLEPIIFEDYEEFSKENHRQDIAETVKILSNDGRISILANDLTRTLINNMRKRIDQNETLKLVYQGSTFKNTEQGIKSFKKIGAEYIGAKPLEADIEMLKLVVEILELIGEEYILEISHSSILDNILREYDVDELLRSDVFEELKQRDSFKQKLLPLDLELKKHFSKNPNIVYNMAMVSTQEYYSGIIFKAYIKSANGSVINGGRYKVKETSNGKLEALGFSVEIDNLNKVISKLK